MKMNTMKVIDYWMMTVALMRTLKIPQQERGEKTFSQKNTGKPVWVQVCSCCLLQAAARFAHFHPASASKV